MVLIVVWVGAAGGVALKMLWPHAPRWLGVPFYLALGWVAVFVLPDLLPSGGVAVLVLIALGGLLYSVGAVFYAPRRPNTWPEHLRVPRVLPRLRVTRRVVPLRRHLLAACFSGQPAASAACRSEVRLSPTAECRTGISRGRGPGCAAG